MERESPLRNGDEDAQVHPDHGGVVHQSILTARRSRPRDAARQDPHSRGYPPPAGLPRPLSVLRSLSAGPEQTALTQSTVAHTTTKLSTERFLTYSTNSIRSTSYVSCWRAKAFLARKGYHAKVVHTTNEELGELLKHFARGLSRKRTTPYLFINLAPWALPRTLSRSSARARSNAWYVARYRRQVG
jgi:glutaredoxin